jgi:hypothetical protein
MVRYHALTSGRLRLDVISREKELEDTKKVITIRNSKDRQYNGQTKRDKRTNNELQTLHIKLKIE